MSAQPPVELSIETLAYGGDGVAHLEDGRAVFVSHAVPGDRLSAEVTQSKKTYARAKILNILEPGPGRVEAPCPVFGTCGGCQWQPLSYPDQLKAKQDFVLQALRRIGGFEAPLLNDIVPAADPFHYRNKAILPVQESLFGFYREASHDIIELPEIGCAIQSDATNMVLKSLRPRLSRFKGLRHIALRSNSQAETLLALVSAEPLPASAKKEAAAWLLEWPGLRGVLNNIQPKFGNVVFGEETRVLAGAETLVEDLGGFKFRLSIASFFQVNPAQTMKLWDLLKSVRPWKGSEKVLELYCGVGTLSLPLARLAGSLLGVEAFAPAVEDARVNASLNAITNARFEAADAGRGFELLPDPDVVVVDPPRKGLSPELIQSLLLKKPKELIYVSCDPSSLARDLKALGTAYELKSAQPLDMFPQTYHVESLAWLALTDRSGLPKV